MTGVLAASALAALVGPGVAGATVKQSPPPSAIVGGWAVTGHQDLADGGATTFHYLRGGGGAGETTDAEIQWHRSSAADIGQQLEAQGLQAGGTMPTPVLDQRIWNEFLAGAIEEAGNMNTNGTARVYTAPHSGSGLFQAAGVWEEAGFTYVVAAQVPSLYMLERLLERVERLDGDSAQATISARRRHARRRARRHHARRHHGVGKGNAAH